MDNGYQDTGNLRIHNPFRDLLITELIEDVDLYRDMFSDNILVGEAISVFLPGNVIVVGPLGSGKTMLLNLIRLPVVAKLLQIEAFPYNLSDVPPYFGISINLSRASFFSFGERSVARAIGVKHDPILETSAAADYFSYFLLLEFVKGLRLCMNGENSALTKWLRIKTNDLTGKTVPTTISNWDCWNGWLDGCENLDSISERCQNRISFWKRFLNTDEDKIPAEIWERKADVERAMHNMGNLIRSLSTGGKLSLFVLIDQYEEAIKLSRTHGNELQRFLNKLIKARDPVVFYRIGARTYDWGTELRVSGSESRIEEQRDFTIVDLTKLLLRGEDRVGYIYPEFAADAARRRLKRLEEKNIDINRFKSIFGKWTAAEESEKYFKSNEIERMRTTIKGLSVNIEDKILSLCADFEHGAALEIRLAAAWALQQIKNHGKSEASVIEMLDDFPWQKKWWQKERREIGLVQLSSHSNSRRRYFGWETLLSLSGGNISLFILLCSEIWDVAARLDLDPLDSETAKEPLDYKIQTRGIVEASRKWIERDRNESEGAIRHDVIDRLGAAIDASIKNDWPLSNPGWTGFSIPEHSLSGSKAGIEVSEFLRSAVSYAILEERPHKSKHRGDVPRVKYYLHPILSPLFDIPIKRVKEPYYCDLAQVYSWLFESGKVRFGTMAVKRTRKSSLQSEVRLWEDA